MLQIFFLTEKLFVKLIFVIFFGIVLEWVSKIFCTYSYILVMAACDLLDRAETLKGDNFHFLISMHIFFAPIGTHQC